MRILAIAASMLACTACFSPDRDGGGNDESSSSSGSGGVGTTLTATTASTATTDSMTATTTAGPTSSTLDTSSGSETANECGPAQLECDGECVDCPEDDGIDGLECSGGMCVVSGCAEAFFPCGGTCCGWMVSNVEQSGPSSLVVDIALNTADQPNVVYAYSAGIMTPFLRHAAYDGFNWTPTDITGIAVDLPYADIAIDANDAIHAVFSLPEGSDNIGHAVNAGAGWSLATVYAGSVGNDYAGAQVEVDTQGRAHATYRNESFMGEVFHAYEDGSGWNTFIDVAGSLDTGLPSDSFSIATASNDQPHLVFYNQNQGELGHAVKTGPLADVGGWSETTVDLGEVFSPSVSISSSDDLQVAYYNGTDGELIVATRSGVTWDRETVWTDGATRHLDMAHGGDDQPHIAFIDDADRLLHATEVDGAWVVDVVDDGGGADWVAIASDSGGVPHIVFHDATYGGIRYAIAGL